MDAHLKRAKEHNPESSQSARQLLEYGYWKGTVSWPMLKMQQILPISSAERINTPLFGRLTKAVATESSMNKHLL